MYTQKKQKNMGTNASQYWEQKTCINVYTVSMYLHMNKKPMYQLITLSMYTHMYDINRFVLSLSV